MGIRFRWPFVLRSTRDAEAAATIDDQAGEIRDCHERVATLDALVVACRAADRDHWAERLRLANRVEERDAEIARLRAGSAPVVAPFWLGLPNELLTMVVTTNMDGLQAVLGTAGRDDESDDPRVNLSLPFALGPI
jgi:predicted membrane-bound mannosyltransferase